MAFIDPNQYQPNLVMTGSWDASLPESQRGMVDLNYKFRLPGTYDQGYEVAGNPFSFLGRFISERFPGLQEYGNALLSPFTGSLDAQPLGSSGLYGNNPDGSPRGMGEALKYIGERSQERNRLIEEAMRGNSR